MFAFRYYSIIQDKYRIINERQARKMWRIRDIFNKSLHTTESYIGVYRESVVICLRDEIWEKVTVFEGTRTVSAPVISRRIN